MLTKTLQHLIDQNLTTAREIGELSGVSTSTVYRWMSGQSHPDFDSIRLLVRHLTERRAQEAILQVFPTGTPWQFTHEHLELDVNEDGHINAKDATVGAVRGAAESLQKVRAAHRGQSFSADDTLQLFALLNQVIRQCTITQRVFVQLSEERRKRKLKLAE